MNFFGKQKNLEVYRKTLVGQKVSKINSFRKDEISFHKSCCILKWGYLSVVTPHICNIKEAKKSATQNLLDIRKFWKRRKLHYVRD